MTWAIDEVAVVSARTGSAAAIKAQISRLGKKRGIALSYQLSAPAPPREQPEHRKRQDHGCPPHATTARDAAAATGLREEADALVGALHHARQPAIRRATVGDPGDTALVQIRWSAVPVQT